jgi:hypothetical protein
VTSDESQCLRCHRPNPDPEPPTDWEAITDADGRVLGVICEDCITPEEQQAMDEQMMAESEPGKLTWVWHDDRFAHAQGAERLYVVTQIGEYGPDSYPWMLLPAYHPGYPTRHTNEVRAMMAAQMWESDPELFDKVMNGVRPDKHHNHQAPIGQRWPARVQKHDTRGVAIQPGCESCCACRSP